MVGQMRQSEADCDLPIAFQLPQLSYYDILQDVQDSDTAQQSEAFYGNDTRNAYGMSLCHHQLKNRGNGAKNRDLGCSPIYFLMIIVFKTLRLQIYPVI